MNRPKVYCIPDVKNWGDAFTPFLLKEGFGVDVEDLRIGHVPNEVLPEHVGEWRKNKDLANRRSAEVFSCGSLMERIPDGFTGHVLGSGMGYKETRRCLTCVQAPFLVRGRLTAER